MGDNYADSGDHDLQVGRILPAGSRSEREQPPADTGTGTNIRSSNATVGEQVDVITGPVVINWHH